MSNTNIDTKTSPKHWTDMKDMSPVNIIEFHSLNFHLGNSIKYILRAGKKEGESILDDLRKARWYLDRQISNLEKEEGDKNVSRN